MPELPDIEAYLTALDERIAGKPLEGIKILKPFVLRTQAPPLETLEGRRVRELRRIGKRIAIGLEGDYWLVLHLMIAGRLHWKVRGSVRATKNTLALFDFPDGTLVLTEAGTKRRASLRAIQGRASLGELDPGGIDPLACSFDEFRNALSAENHTLKRALTDPRTLSGVGNAYSDEILHAAGLSPLLLTARLNESQWRRLFDATRETLQLWIRRLRSEAEREFPEKVTAFREDMAVHGRYGKPCLRCGESIRRIRYADNETNYCARCQNEGKVLADRALSRLLK